MIESILSQIVLIRSILHLLLKGRFYPNKHTLLNIYKYMINSESDIFWATLVNRFLILLTWNRTLPRRCALSILKPMFYFALKCIRVWVRVLMPNFSISTSIFPVKSVKGVQCVAIKQILDDRALACRLKWNVISPWLVVYVKFHVSPY